MNEAQALARMVPPGRKRRGIWRNGVLQIHITRACDLACHGCTQGSNLAGKVWMMPPEEFEKAVDSLKGYFGVIGVFGGNPAMAPKFDEYCRILRDKVPFEQRGLWCNHPSGKGAIMRETFNPAVSNLNVHLSREAYDEFARDWPECRNRLKGLAEDWPEAAEIRCARPGDYESSVGDSRHSPPFVAMQDVIDDASKRWELIAGCDVNRFWSAMICWIPDRGLRAYFCELAAAQAILHAADPDWHDLGLPVEPNWWRRPMEDFAAQVRFHCHRCGIPLRRYGQLAIGGEFEEVSETHAGVYRPKRKERDVQLVTLENADGRTLTRATDYVQNGALK